MTRPTNPVLLSDRLRDLAAELSRHAPKSADRLLRAKTAREFLEVVRELFNLASTFTPDHYSFHCCIRRIFPNRTRRLSATISIDAPKLTGSLYFKIDDVDGLWNFIQN